MRVVGDMMLGTSRIQFVHSHLHQGSNYCWNYVYGTDLKPVETKELHMRGISFCSAKQMLGGINIDPEFSFSF